MNPILKNIFVALGIFFVIMGLFCFGFKRDEMNFRDQLTELMEKENKTSREKILIELKEILKNKALQK